MTMLWMWGRGRPCGLVWCSKESTCAVTRPRPLALKGAALPEATSFGVVSSGAVPLGVGELASLTRRRLHLRPVAAQGNGQGCHWRDAPSRCTIVRQSHL